MTEEKDIFDFDFLLLGTGDSIFRVNIERQPYLDFLKEYAKVQSNQTSGIKVEKLKPSNYLLYSKICELQDNRIKVEEVAEEAVEMVRAFHLGGNDTTFYRPIDTSEFYLLGKKKL